MVLVLRGKTYSIDIMVDGVRHYKSTGLRNRRLAEAVERRFKDEVLAKEAGLTELKPEMTFTELSARFLASGEVKAHHAGRLKMLLPFWGHRELRSINRGIVREYRQARMKGKKLSETTVSRDLEVLRHLLYWAVDEGILAANPLARLRMARPRKQKRLILSWEDEQRLIAAAAPHLKRMIVAAVDTGMRRGELTHQRFEDLDLTRGIVSVTRSKTAEGEQREIPLTDRLRSMLAVSRQAEGPVFPFNGEAITQIKTAWAAAIRRSGIQRLRFHDLRHCFNTRLLELGILPDVRKALMGHSSGEDVHSMYSHVELPLKRKAIGLLDGWIREQMERSQSQSKEAIDAGSDPGIPDSPGQSGGSTASQAI